MAELKQGDILHITLGTDEAAFRYTFTVETPGEWPGGYLVEVSPDGRINEGAFSLHGSGEWTTQKENPVQKQQHAFTSYFDSITMGDFMVGAIPGAKRGERLIFDKPGQAITRIEVT